MLTKNLLFGLLLVLVVVIIAGVAWYKNRGADHFSLTAPATPLVREAAANLFVSLKTVVSVGRGFASAAAASADPNAAGARQGVEYLTKVLDSAETALSGSPPTYANYLAVYRSLADSDETLLSAADAYATGGRALVAAGSASLGASLSGVGAQLRRVVVSVHRLGVALDME